MVIDTDCTGSCKSNYLYEISSNLFLLLMSLYFVTLLFFA